MIGKISKYRYSKILRYLLKIVKIIGGSIYRMETRFRILPMYASMMADAQMTV